MQSGDKSDNVVELQVPEIPPWVLGCMTCEGQLFFLHKDGQIQCGDCGNVVAGIKAELIET